MMKVLGVIVGLFLLIALPASAGDVTLKSEDEKMMYLIGVVTARNLDVGHFLQANATAAPLFVVTRMDPVRVWVEVPEADAGLVADGAAAAGPVRPVNSTLYDACLVAVSTLTCALPLPGLCTGGTSAVLARLAL